MHSMRLNVSHGVIPTIRARYVIGSHQTPGSVYMPHQLATIPGLIVLHPIFEAPTAGR